MSNEERALEALIAAAMRDPTRPLTREEIDKFMREYDQGLHRLSPEDEAALAGGWEQIKKG